MADRSDARGPDRRSAGNAASGDSLVGDVTIHDRVISEPTRAPGAHVDRADGDDAPSFDDVSLTDEDVKTDTKSALAVVISQPQPVELPQTLEDGEPVKGPGLPPVAHPPGAAGHPRPSTYPEAPPDWAKGPSPWVHEQSAPRRKVGPGLVERVKQATRGKRKLVLGVAAGALVAIALVVVVASGGDPASGEPAVSETAQSARELYVNGETDAAIELLEGAEIENDPHAHVVLGHACMLRDRRADATAAYERAITLDRSRARDAALRRNLRDLMGDAKVDRAEAAFAVARLALADASDVDLRAMLAELASAHPRRHTRQLALAMARQFEFVDRVDVFNSLVLDLGKSKRCKHRRAAVAALRELGDRRAIEPLRRAASGKQLSRRQGKNKCLKKAAIEAIAHLESLTEER